MDSNLLIRSVTSKLLMIRNALVKRKSFLINAPGSERDLFFATLLIMKTLAAAFGMQVFVPKRVTFLFLFSVVCIQVFIGPSGLSMLEEALHLVAHMWALTHLDPARFLAYNTLIWLTYCLSPPSEFFLDCYLLITFLFFVIEMYAERPHRLSTLMCVLYAVNCITRLFTGESEVSSLLDLQLLYAPVVAMYAVEGNVETLALIDSYVAIWMAFELYRTDVGSRGRQFSLDVYFKDIYELLGAYQRKPFLNVEANGYFILFNFIMIIKSFIAGYATINIVGEINTSKIMLMNWILTFFSRNGIVIFYGLIRFLINAGFHYPFYGQRHSVVNSSAVWFCVCVRNDLYHFFLDTFLIVSALIYVKKAYEGNSDQISSLICLLWLAEWLSDALAVEPLGRLMTVATLYLPVMLLSASSTLKYRHKVFSVFTFISLWFVFRLNRNTLRAI